MKLPRDGEKDNDAWESARAAAKVGLERWVKLVWKRQSYVTRDALVGYAPDPDFSKLPSFDELCTLAFGGARCDPRYVASDLPRAVRYCRQRPRSMTTGI